MNQFKKTLICAAILTLTTSFISLPAHAAKRKKIKVAQPSALMQLKQEIQRLRSEVDQLKLHQAAPAPVLASPTVPLPPPTTDAVSEKAHTEMAGRVEQLEIKAKDAVVSGDTPGSFRLPGSDTSVKIYGFAEAHAIYDIDRPGSSDNFTDLPTQPLYSSNVPKGRTQFTAETSRFGFETSTPTTTGAFTTKIEADFYAYGDNRNRLRLRHAYGEYANFLIGQTWSTFMDLDNLPETVDFNGPIGAPFSRRPMIRYTYNNPNMPKITVALENPNSEHPVSGYKGFERLPQIIARFDKGFDSGNVNLRLLAHEKRSASETKRGYGLGVGGAFKITDKDTLMSQYTYVKGDFDHLIGTNGYAVAETTGAITLYKTHGLVMGYAKTFNDQLRGTLALGFNKNIRNDKADDAELDLNKTLKQIHVGMIYSPFKNIELGAEYIYGKRKTFSGDAAKMSKFDLMARYSF
jgi:opacity protein-like surface antigen